MSVVQGYTSQVGTAAADTAAPRDTQQYLDALIRLRDDFASAARKLDQLIFIREARCTGKWCTSSCCSSRTSSWKRPY